jgi:hypothetical protein
MPPSQLDYTLRYSRRVKERVKEKTNDTGPQLHPLISELYELDIDDCHDANRETIFYRVGYCHAVDRHARDTFERWTTASSEDQEAYNIGYEDGLGDRDEWDLRYPHESDIIQP